MDKTSDKTEPKFPAEEQHECRAKVLLTRRHFLELRNHYSTRTPYTLQALLTGGFAGPIPCLRYSSNAAPFIIHPRTSARTEYGHLLSSGVVRHAYTGTPYEGIISVGVSLPFQHGREDATGCNQFPPQILWRTDLDKKDCL